MYLVTAKRPPQSAPLLQAVLENRLSLVCFSLIGIVRLVHHSQNVKGSRYSSAEIRIPNLGPSSHIGALNQGTESRLPHREYLSQASQSLRANSSSALRCPILHQITMAPIPGTGENRLKQLIRIISVPTCERPMRKFVPEGEFLAQFDRRLLDEILAQYPEQDRHASDNDHIFGKLRKTLAILVEIGCGHSIYDFCRRPTLLDTALPLTKDHLFGILEENNVRSFCETQYQFIPVPFDDKMSRLVSYDHEWILPIIKRERIKNAHGGFAFVDRIEIHKEYDRLGWQPERGDSPVRLIRNPSHRISNRG
jgi:hypothetical protein